MCRTGLPSSLNLPLHGRPALLSFNIILLLLHLTVLLGDVQYMISHSLKICKNL